MIRNARGGIYLIGAGLAADRDLDTGRGERARAGGHHPEDIHHVTCSHRFRLLVHAGIVHLNPGNAGSRMLHLVPFLACLDIFLHQLGKGIKLVLIGLDELKVRAAGCLFGSDVLSGKPPVLMQDLALETTESRLDCFRLTAVGSGRPMDMADL